jgi:phosphoribosylamine---glycine ligase
MISGGGDGLGLALRLKQEGHDVGVFIREGPSKSNYDGLLSKPKKWDEFLDPETIIMFDSSGGGRTAERLRARGHFVFAGSSFADQLELDRPLALDFMQQAGIKTPESRTFRSWERGKTYAKEHATRLVFKASGETSKHLGSYVSYDSGDLVEMLDYFAEIAPGKPEFILQEFIEGTEISTEGWFNGREFMTPFNHTIERKQLMNDGLGPSGGCAGNLVWLAKETNHVIEEGLAKMASILRDHEYMGPIDLNTVVNNQGVWGLEFTPRFGYDALPALLELVQGEIGGTIAAIARGEYPTTLPLENRFASGLRISIPPYPSEHFHSDEGIPIRGLTRDDRSHLYFFDVKLDDKTRLVSTHAYGAVVTVTGVGDSIMDAMAGPMEIAKRAKIPQKQYRTDLTKLFITEWAKFDQLVRREEVAIGLSEVKV